MRVRLQGMTMVGWAIIGVAGLIILLGVMEVSRALFVWNTIKETARRGARVAAVCPMYHPAVKRTIMFGESNGSNHSSVLAGLSNANISLLYLDKYGNVTMNYSDVAYVRVGIYNYQHTLLMPFIVQTMTLPSFTATLPTENLGYIPVLGTRQCFGS